MDTTIAHSHDEHHHDDHHGHDHHDPGFWRKYVFSTDHKTIGIQYGLSSLTFLFLGFCMMMLMRWQLAFPGKRLPVLGDLLANLFPGQMPGGIMSPDFYNSLGAMHGTIMVFLGIVPLGFAAFGNYVMPLQIGAVDMTFPRLNMASFWSFFAGGMLMMLSFFLPGGAAKSGWTSYSPLASTADQAGLHIPGFLGKIEHIPHLHIFGSIYLDDVFGAGAQVLPFFNGQTLWLLGMILLIISSLLGSVNFIATIVQLRAPGMTWMRLPFFVWAQLITAFLLLLAFPPLEAAGLMQFMDRVFGTSFFLPSGLVVQNVPVHISGGGSPLLWQHLFWFLGHPEVYIMILPGIGIVAEVVANNTRKPLWGYKAMVGGIFVLGFLSFIVWAHHMYLTGMGSAVSAFFQATTIIISIPSVILLASLLISLWGGAIRFTLPMMFATAFMPMFGIGGLTGIPLAFNAIDLYLHDTYYIIGHFHYVVAPGALFSLFAGVYHWYPKATGRMLNVFWGRVHFWGSLVCLNALFFPMLLQGMIGMHRRWYDGGLSYPLTSNQHVMGLPGIEWNLEMSIAAWVLGLFQIPFIINFSWSMTHGEKVGTNPWDATTLDWDTPSPPPHGNFTKPITVYRGPYEYSVPGAEKDFTPQSEPEVPGAAPVPAPAH